MASPLQTFNVCRCWLPSSRPRQPKAFQLGTNRLLSTTRPSQSSRRSGGGPTRLRPRDKEDALDEKFGTRTKDTVPRPFRRVKIPDDLPPDYRQVYDSATPEEQEQAKEDLDNIGDYMTSYDVQTKFQSIIKRQSKNIDRMERAIAGKGQVPEEGLLNLGEEDPDEQYEDDDMLAEGDDMTALGHLELDAHRDYRQYARIIAWEMPLLHNLAKPFEPPSGADKLRFRYTTYMGEDHPAEKKVVVQFAVSDLEDLSAQESDKLIKLAGPRYNPETGIIKMSCESFDAQAQNTRYLGDTVNKLIAEAKDPSDQMTDIPFDFRHHRANPQYKFPESWKITPERKARLNAKRAMQIREPSEVLTNLHRVKPAASSTETSTIDTGAVHVPLNGIEETVTVPR